MMQNLKDVPPALFKMNAKLDNNKVDGFRFIDNLQTTVRQLSVFSAIILELNNKQLPKKILEQLLINWSLQEEILNQNYREGKGKITNDGTKTAAIGYYLQTSSSLGITTRFNDVYMNTKLSQTFLYFLNNKSNHNESLTLCERVFYLFKLFTNDADGIILCLSQLAHNKKKKQFLLQSEFKEALNSRLLSKMELTNSQVKSEISTKFRIINFIWKSPQKYAEHIIAPRYEWLSSLGLVKIKREKKDTLYSLSDQGQKLYNMLGNFGESNLKDINQHWLQNHFFDVVNQVFNFTCCQKYSTLAFDIQDFELGQSLEKAVKSVKSSLSFKLSIVEAFFFVSLDLLANRSIIINFSEIQDKLEKTFSYNSKLYYLKLSGRVNEGYITITLKK